MLSCISFNCLFPFQHFVSFIVWSFIVLGNQFHNVLVSTLKLKIPQISHFGEFNISYGHEPDWPNNSTLSKSMLFENKNKNLKSEIKFHQRVKREDSEENQKSKKNSQSGSNEEKSKTKSQSGSNEEKSKTNSQSGSNEGKTKVNSHSGSNERKVKSTESKEGKVKHGKT